jgi:alkanesulfonate monooxygenase SsuD/methylene tetrahydromethanopterin reductase-like flavin-dependent oxidoreductase (luciferase family)
VGSRERPHPPEAVLRRVARLADGWSPNFTPDAAGREIVARVHGYAREAGRDPDRLPLEGRVRLAGQDPAGWRAQAEQWHGLGASHLIAEARGANLSFPAGHLATLRTFRTTIS